MKSITILLLILSACSASPEIGELTTEEANLAFDDVVEIPITRQPEQGAQGLTDKALTQKLVKTGGIDFESENVEADYQKIRNLLPQYQAYVQREDQSKSPYRITYSVTIRVPSSVYDSLFNQISALAFRLENRYSNVQDVTERYYDLQTRIKNKKSLEQRYLKLLDKANEIKDILEIEKNINQVRTDIERLQGQFKLLSKQVSLSTIDLSFYESLPYVHDASNRKGFGERIFSAFYNGWEGFLSFLVGITTLWPFLFALLGGVYLIRKWKIKRKENKAESPEG